MNMYIYLYNKSIHVKILKIQLKCQCLSYCEEETISLNKGNKIPIYAVYMKHTKKKKKTHQIPKSNVQMLT